MIVGNLEMLEDGTLIVTAYQSADEVKRVLIQQGTEGSLFYSDADIRGHEDVGTEDMISRQDMLDAVGHGTTYTSEELQKIISERMSVTPVAQKAESLDEDCVSRQAVFDILEDNRDGWSIDNADSVFDKIESLPSISPLTRDYMAEAGAFDLPQEEVEKLMDILTSEDEEAVDAGDCISRQAAIETALTFLVEFCGGAFDIPLQKRMKGRLDNLPSVKPKGMSEEIEEEEHDR